MSPPIFLLTSLPFGSRSRTISEIILERTVPIISVINCAVKTSSGKDIMAPLDLSNDDNELSVIENIIPLLCEPLNEKAKNRQVWILTLNRSK